MDDRTIKKTRVNDIAAVENAGAYGYSTSSNHSCRLKLTEASTDKYEKAISKRDIFLS